MLSCPPDLPKYLVTVALISPALNVYGLTPRELEILGLLVEGWPNARIAAALFVAARTVATHVEHILAELAVARRSAAAVLALRPGLYVPRLLASGTVEA
jgi:DNA-binding NarL/FixJ family response regulator